MGMNDQIRCDYPIDAPDVQDDLWQTKSIVCCLDEYSIHADGTLWHEVYDEHNDGSRDNPRWLQVSDFNGELEIHTSKDERWYSVRFWFRDGVVKDKILSVSDLPGRTQDASD